jgi:hypothetical protein
MRRSSRAPLRVLDEAAQSVHEFHLLDRATARLEESWRADQKSKALRARDRDVEAIAGE